MYVCVCMYKLNGHKNTKHSKIHAQYVGSEQQWGLCQYKIRVVTTKTPTLIRDKMEYRGSPHCLPSDCRV